MSIFSGANVNVGKERLYISGDSPLHNTARNGTLESAKLLIEKGS